MRSSFAGLEIALRGLSASQLAQETAGHNIANANTEGYSRQEVQMKATRAYATPIPGYDTMIGQIGTGVEITEIKRYHDAFLDLSYRSQNEELGKWTAIQATLGQVELILPEPSNSGLNSQLSAFSNAWEDLANKPQDDSTRAAVRQQASNLCSTINSVYDQLITLQSQLNSTIPANVVELNSLAKEVADFNKQIKSIEMTGDNANDLRDQRDVVLDKLSNLVGITYKEQDDGQVSVYVGGTSLIYGNSYNELTTVLNANNRWDVQWKDTGIALNVRSGEMAGTLISRDDILDEQISNLDLLTQGLRDAVNAVHQQGYQLNSNTHGGDFFVGTGAKDIALDADILSSTDYIAAAGATYASGDGTIAAKISALLTDNEVVVDSTTIPVTTVGDIIGTALGGKTITDFYQATMIQNLSIDSKAAQDNVTNTTNMAETLQQQRDSVSGVSLDDETASLIRYQRAYQAAARVMTVVDEMLDKLINGTGSVGR
jgi:flagellar hook-associated protein 1 FlgK